MAPAGASSLLLVLASLLSAASCCPRPCSCTDRQSRHFAECSSKDLAAIPRFLPRNASTVSLSANRLASVPAHSFRSSPRVTSLWMTRNLIASVESGAVSDLVHLRNLDLSYNKLRDFPWSELENLTSLQLLKLDHNELERIPRDAFSSLKELNSLRLNDNNIVAIEKGAFDPLMALSHLQLHNNPYACTCTLGWLQLWILKTEMNIPDQDGIICAAPRELRGELFLNLPDTNCKSPTVMINIESDHENGSFFEGSPLVLSCAHSGSPLPVATWKIDSKKELALKLTDNDSAVMLDDSLKVYNNGTLVISSLKMEDGGMYSCYAANEAGQDEKSVVVEVLARERPASEDSAEAESAFETTDSREEADTKPVDWVKPVRKCSLSADTTYASSRVANASFDDVKQYTFDFGVIALAVTETEADVRLNPLLTPQDPDEAAGDDNSSGIFLCLREDQSALQWTRLKHGVSAYRFAKLRPGTNYSLCLTLRSEDCDVQVNFATKKHVPNLVVIVSVSICLLTVSTVPLLAATCYHLHYKYRCQTYKIYLTARGRYGVERASFRVQTDSEKTLSEDLAEDEGTDSGEKDTEESILADSESVDKLTAECEGGSEYSDRLPLGAEALTITQ